jgi:anti-sigma factor RsiW
MCDQELLLSYLYDELPSADRQAFDRHLASCADCRAELDGLRGARTHLTSWTPPEPDLGFQIVRSARPVVSPARWWRASPAWGLAAAALLTVAVSAAIANVEVRFGGDGVVVRTGWNRDATGAPGQAPTVLATAASTSSDIKRVEARLKELESQLAARPTAAAVPAGIASRMSDAEIVRYVRQQVSDSEQRQQGELARQILQVNHDTEVARRADVDRLLVAYRELQGTNFQTSRSVKALEDHFVRVGLQR